MFAALALPQVLERRSDRTVMLGGIALCAAGLFAGTMVTTLPDLVALWFVLGLGYATAQTPGGRLLRRSAHPADRPALFAAQFALSHACWLVFYPLAGWLAARHGLPLGFAVLGVAAVLAAAVAARVWPAQDPDVVPHAHADLPAGHAHLQGSVASACQPVHHAHAFVIDEQHPRWPRAGQ
jgi:MFS family permease